MSSDVAFWSAASGDPGEAFDRLADGDATGLRKAEAVLAFRQAILSRWPDLADVMEPDVSDLRDEPEKAQKYVLLCLSYRQLDYLDDIYEQARTHGLKGFSGVADAAF